MSEHGPDGPYVYQPYGSVEKERGERLYGVGGYFGAEIKGLTKDEANSILSLLLGRRSPGEEEIAEFFRSYQFSWPPFDPDFGRIDEHSPLRWVLSEKQVKDLAHALASRLGAIPEQIEIALRASKLCILDAIATEDGLDGKRGEDALLKIDAAFQELRRLNKEEKDGDKRLS